MNVIEDVKVFCPTCNGRLSAQVVAFLLEVGNGFHCSCGTRVTNHTYHMKALTSARTIPSLVRNFVWHHATFTENWYETVSRAGAMVHVGEYVTSQELAVSELLTVPAPGMYFWEVAVKPDSLVGGDIFEDTDSDKSFPEGVGSLYMNRYEAPGSMSLYIDARSLSPISVVFRTREEVLAQPSFYLL